MLKIVNVSLLGILTLILFSCSSKKNEIPVQEKQTSTNEVILTDDQYKNAAITTGVLEQSELSSVVKLNGKIDVPPQNLVSISMPMGGYLKSTKLLPGMHIKKGEILAIMEDQQYIQLQQDYLMTKSRLHFAELEYNRQKALNQGQASSDKAVQQAESEVNSNRIMLQSFTEKLKLLHINPTTLSESSISKSVAIHSPINGFVSKVNVNIGKYVNPSDVLFELVNPEDIHLNMRVFEKDISKLSLGQNLEAYSNANPEKKYRCKIILISKEIAPDGSTEVHCHFDNYDHTLLPGMYMNANVELKKAKVFAINEDAIVLFEGKNYVFIEKSPKMYEMVEVTLGQKEGNRYEIQNFENFKSKNIVTKGAYTLLMKSKNTSDE